MSMLANVLDTRQGPRSDRELVESQLRRAAELDALSPHEGDRIRRAVIELYADDPWAAELVEKAQTALKQNQK